MKKIVLSSLLFLISAISFCQTRIKRNELYFKDKVAYTEADNMPFSGIAESKNNKGHLIFDEEYDNGFKNKYTLYYNGGNKAIAKEIYYFEKSFNKQKEVKYSGDKSKTWYTHYDAEGKKTLKETYLGNKVIYSCEYKRSKKHGKEFCTNKDGSDCVRYYWNGKKIKN